MKILVNNQDWGQNEMRRLNDTYGGVGYYRLWKPYQQIVGHDKEFIGQAIKRYGPEGEERWDKLFQDNDVYWTSYFCNDKVASNIFYHRDKHKKKVIVDVDDNYLDILASNPLYDKYKPTKKNRSILGATLFFSDAVTVSTEPLKQRLIQYFKEIHGQDLSHKIYVLPNFNDLEDWNHRPAKKKKFIIGYSGSNSHHDDLEMMMPHLGRLMEKYPHVHCEIVGSLDHNHFNVFETFSSKVLNRCEILSGTWTFNEYPAYLANRGWSIGLAPLVDSPFTRCKSPIKFFEYSTYAIPTIASPVYPYIISTTNNSVITDEENALLAKPSEWFEKMERLVLDAELREKLGTNAKKHIIDHWQYKDSGLGEKINKMLGEISRA